MGSSSVTELLALAEELRNGVNALPDGMSVKIRELISSIISQPTKRRKSVVFRKRRAKRTKPKIKETLRPKGT